MKGRRSNKSAELKPSGSMGGWVKGPIHHDENVCHRDLLRSLQPAASLRRVPLPCGEAHPVRRQRPTLTAPNRPHMPFTAWGRQSPVGNLHRRRRA